MPTRAPAAAKVDPLDEEVRRLLAGEHSDPHRILGAHPSGSATASPTTTIRAYRPGAEGIAVLREGHEPVAMERLNPAGFFAADLEGEVGAYQLRVTYEGGLAFDIDDP